MSSAPSYPKKSGTFQSFDGTKIYYEIRGEGPPMFFAYGIVCLINHWRYQIDHFSKTHTTIIMDYRGHHFSEVPEDKKNLSLDALAEDVIALCKHLNISAADFLGHSFGNEVLLQAYLKKPELFKSFTMVSAFFANPFEHFVHRETLRDVFVYVKKAYNQSPALMHKLWKFGTTNPISIWLSSLVGGFNLKHTALSDIEIYAQGVANIDIRVFITLFEELIQHDSTNALSSLEIPVLLLAGSKDSLTSSKAQETIKSHIKDCQYHMMSNGSHCLQLDFPTATNDLIEDFLNS